MPDILTTGVERSPQHDSTHAQAIAAASKLQAQSTNSQIFEYRIRATFRRKHFNWPHSDRHYHDFQVTLHLRAIRNPGELYGLDMCEVERSLNNWIDQIPELVNDLLHSGTTEDLCLFFAQMPLDGVEVLSVEVSETPERVTVWKGDRSLPY